MFPPNFFVGCPVLLSQTPGNPLKALRTCPVLMHLTPTILLSKIFRALPWPEALPAFSAAAALERCGRDPSPLPPGPAI